MRAGDGNNSFDGGNGAMLVSAGARHSRRISRSGASTALAFTSTLSVASSSASTGSAAESVVG